MGKNKCPLCNGNGVLTKERIKRLEEHLKRGEDLSRRLNEQRDIFNKELKILIDNTERLSKKIVYLVTLEKRKKEVKK